MFKRKPKYDSIFEITMRKYEKKEKITYEEYVVLLSTNHEVWFIHDNIEYQVDHSDANTTSMYKTEVIDNKKITEICGSYKGIIELLTAFKINEKRLIEIWDEVSFQ